jgi:hypothetical protein
MTASLFLSRLLSSFLKIELALRATPASQAADIELANFFEAKYVI